MIFTVETYDLAVSKYAIVGHSVLPLFLGAANRNPVMDRKMTEFFLHSGNFQIPMFAAWPNVNAKPFNYIKF